MQRRVYNGVALKSCRFGGRLKLLLCKFLIFGIIGLSVGYTHINGSFASTGETKEAANGNAQEAAQDEYWNAVQDRARACIESKEYSRPALCFLKTTPEKCQPLVYDAMVGLEDIREVARRKWFLCVISCTDANWFSLTFGECSRELE